MRTSDADILIIPGWSGSGPDHWQTRWQAKLATARRVEQADWYKPDREEWAANIASAARAASRPVVLVAHSAGVGSVAHAFAGLEPHDPLAAKVAGPFSSRRPRSGRCTPSPACRRISAGTRGGSCPSAPW